MPACLHCSSQFESVTLLPTHIDAQHQTKVHEAGCSWRPFTVYRRSLDILHCRDPPGHLRSIAEKDQEHPLRQAKTQHSSCLWKNPLNTSQAGLLVFKLARTLRRSPVGALTARLPPQDGRKYGTRPAPGAVPVPGHPSAHPSDECAAQLTKSGTGLPRRPSISMQPFDKKSTPKRESEAIPSPQTSKPLIPFLTTQPISNLTLTLLRHRCHTAVLIDSTPHRKVPRVFDAASDWLPSRAEGFQPSRQGLDTVNCQPRWVILSHTPDKVAC
ncbi:hypothetical protein QBC34DRAFT_398244 [Podospora aff. communis PSN243]|uniref:C2H2-type domain-containing protein n=1 Tax=Podospora aff. communis PSN243 TaxID=3040156 RepID=A0AAV9GVA3_9PEZI|nr:hypothetical protein QBC34DRAFT_398244 [Podospora aff. communis PSN243]